MNTKIKTVSELAPILEALKKEGKKISMTSGSFDVLHAGHAKYLAEAKAQGDVLVVLLNSDVSIKGYKGPTRPIIPEDDRAELLSALSAVDYIVLFDELTPLTVLETLHPDVYCNGADYGENCIEKDIVEKNGGVVHIIPLADKSTNSTSSIIARILDMTREEGKDKG